MRKTYFTTVDELLLRIYYLYEKSPKKCHELNEVVAELKQCLKSGDQGGNRPLKACSTRFVAHKVAALEIIIECFGAYVSHLSSLTEDTSVRAVDRQKLVGYVHKWRNAKMLLGCAYFHDVLKPMSVLCKALQSDEICVVRALEAILKTTRDIERVKEAHLQDLPSIRMVTLRIKRDGEACTYQGANLLSYLEGVQFFENHRQGYIDLVQSCLKQRMTEHGCFEWKFSCFLNNTHIRMTSYIFTI